MSELPSLQGQPGDPEVAPPQLQPPSPGATQLTSDASPHLVDTAVNVEEFVPNRRNKKWTTNPAEGVDLIIGQTGMEADEPTTVGRMFKDTVERIPDHPAHMYKENGQWESITYKEYYDRCFAAAKSFLKVQYTVVYTRMIRIFDVIRFLYHTFPILYINLNEQ